MIAHGELLVEGLSIPCAWVSHYHAHAASAFWASSFADADIMCLDGGGDFGEGGWFCGNDNHIELIQSYLDVEVGSSYHHFSHRVYNTTSGFYESKVMAIASYGKREYCRNSHLSGSGHLNSISPDIPPTVHDIADFQYQFEQFVLGLLQQADRKSENLCCAGGCFLNVTLNRVIANSGMYKSIYVPPYAGDMGTAIGCALYAVQSTRHQLPNSALLDTAFWGDDISTDLHQLRAVISVAGDIPIDQTYLPTHL